MPAKPAADYAARALVYFVEGGRLPLPPPRKLDDLRPAQDAGRGLTILALGDYEMQFLALRTTDWIKELKGSVRQVVLHQKDLDNQPIHLAIIGAGTLPSDLETIALLSRPPSVIFWPSGSPNSIRHY